MKSVPVRYAGTGTDGAAVMMPLGPAQRLLHKPGLVKALFVSNTGGVGASDEVIKLLQPIVGPLGLESDNTRQDSLETADAQGATFMALFTTFGSFSIAAGILLIFLVFVMLAAERRAELGIARAVGTRRRHLTSMFVFEGLAYDLLAALVGALVGLGIAYGMVLVIAAAFGETADVTISYSVRPESVVVAYAIGVLLTLAVVAFSAMRVSRMNSTFVLRESVRPRISTQALARTLRRQTGFPRRMEDLDGCRHCGISTGTRRTPCEHRGTAGRWRGLALRLDRTRDEDFTSDPAPSRRF